MKQKPTQGRPPVNQRLPLDERFNKEWALIRAARKGNRKALALIEQKTEAIRERAVACFQKQRPQLQDAPSVAWLGVLDSLARYDRSKRIPFHKLCARRIIQQVSRHAWRNNTTP